MPARGPHVDRNGAEYVTRYKFLKRNKTTTKYKIITEYNFIINLSIILGIHSKNTVIDTNSNTKKCKILFYTCYLM